MNLPLATTETPTTEPTSPSDTEDALRAQARSVIARENLTKTDAARQAGVAYTTFAAWLEGKYNGNNGRVTEDVAKWLSAREVRKIMTAAMVKAPGFRMTPTAERILAILQYAHTAPDISVIACGAGVGKTTACEHYAKNVPNVWMATMDPSTAGVSTMLRELCHAMDVTERSATELARAVGRKIQGKEGLLIVDEAQHLSTAALDLLRSLHDRWSLGIALVGNEAVYSRLDGEGRKAQFAQLFSRVGMRMTQSQPAKGDIAEMIGAWGITDPDEIAFLEQIAAKPGALRGLTKTLSLASTLANGAVEPRGLKHIRMAWSRRSLG
ncbi:MAG: AAA family ATPase, partial [Alphaproteobacteria bacterium]|nr:AAA family ATPase [Alphaproteobacteria bacterium]